MKGKQNMPYYSHVNIIVDSVSKQRPPESGKKF